MTFLDALVISVSKQMVICLGLVFVILLYRLDCSLITVCSCMAVLCGLLIVGKLNAQMCVLISVYDVSDHFLLIAILVLFIVSLVV